MKLVLLINKSMAIRKSLQKCYFLRTSNILVHLQTTTKKEI